MLIALVIAAGMTGALPIIGVAATALTWVEPIFAAPVLLAAAVKALGNRNPLSRHDLAAGFLRTVAAELRAGRSLRSAVVGAANAVPELGLERVARAATAGRPLDEVAGLLATGDGLGPAAAALRVAARTGGSVVGVFDALTGEAVDEGALERERRTLTVQARLSVGLVGGFPVVVVGFQIANGEVVRLLRRGPLGAGILVVGAALLVAGMGTVWVMLRRAHR